MATQPQTGLTYEDLQAFPDDNLRRELIDGELFVTAAPGTRHQRVVMYLSARLFAYAEEHGGEVLPAPYDVKFSDTSVVEPDVLFVRAEHLDRFTDRYIGAAPDLVVEVTSPTTRRTDVVRKRALYERFGVPEYWFVDLDADRIEVYVLEGDRYPTPTLLERGSALESPLLPGLSLPLDRVLVLEDA